MSTSGSVLLLKQSLDPGLRFWGRRDVGVMSDRGGHGEGQHDQGDVAMPAVPGAGLVVVEAELVFSGLEAVLDGPAVAFDLDQGVDAGPCRTPGGEEGQVAIGDVAADQQAASPQARSGLVVFAGVEVGQFAVGLSGISCVGRA